MSKLILRNEEKLYFDQILLNESQKTSNSNLPHIKMFSHNHLKNQERFQQETSCQQ